MMQPSLPWLVARQSRHWLRRIHDHEFVIQAKRGSTVHRSALPIGTVILSEHEGSREAGDCGRVERSRTTAAARGGHPRPAASSSVFSEFSKAASSSPIPDVTLAT